MQYRSLRASIVLATTLFANVAYADIAPCGGIGPGGPSCPPVINCSNDAECFANGLGRCAFPNGGGSGACSADCNSLFVCNSPSDCPVFDPLVASCRPTVLTGTPGICEYRDATSRPVVTLCGSGPASATTVLPCFSGGSWAAGDCDGDGVLNAVDMDPCAFAVTTTIAPVASPFCLGGHICEGTSAVCAPFLRCSSGGSACSVVASRVGGSGWECSALPVAPGVTFCHPSCDATAHCTTNADCGPLGGCRATATGLSMCIPTALVSCASTCSLDPLDWASAQGDCDGDGFQNGCDTQVCTTNAGSGCNFNHLCVPPDAGITPLDSSVPRPDGSVPDASVPRDATVTLDAGPDAAVGEPDAFVSEPDAAESPDASRRDASMSTIDAGNTPFDAGGTGIDAATTITPGLGFGGGGGCRCAVVGGADERTTGAWLGVGIAVVAIARRRRRVTRR